MSRHNNWKTEVNDGDPQNKECPAKRCKRYLVIVATNSKYCSQCGAKLRRAYPADGENILIDADLRSGQPQGASVQHPTQFDSKNTNPSMVRRRHVTHSEGNEWKCWCGFTCPLNAPGSTGNPAAYHHDQLAPMLVTFDSIPEGGKYLPAEGSSHVNTEIIRPPARGGNGSTSIVTGKNYVPPKNDTFTCTPDLTGCPLLTDASKPRIEIPDDMWSKWIKLARSINTEWLAYLVGTPIPISEEHPFGGWTVTECYFPRQRVTSTHVTVNDEDLRNLRPNTIGDVHSHVNMSAYFSAEDERHFNHPVHIVINARGDFATSCRVMLECHRTARYKGGVYLIGQDNEMEDSLAAAIETPPPTSLAVSSGTSPADSTSSPTVASSETSTPTTSNQRPTNGKTTTWQV